MDETVIMTSYPSHCDWIISEYIIRNNRPNAAIVSPTFLCTRGKEWTLEFFIWRDYSSSIGIKLKRKGLSENLDYSGSYIYILDPTGRQDDSYLTHHIANVTEGNFNDFNISSDDFMNQLQNYLAKGQLTIRFFINACPLIRASSSSTFKCSPMSLVNLFDNPDLSDIMIIVNNTTFYAHRAVLANISLIFATMFKNKKEHKIIRINELSAAAIRKMLYFIYVNAVNFDDNTIHDLSKASHRYEIKELKNLCCQYLIGKLTVQNCIDSIQMAYKLNMHELKFSAINLIVSESELIYQTKEFYELAQKNSDLHVEICKACFKYLNLMIKTKPNYFYFKNSISLT